MEIRKINVLGKSYKITRKCPKEFKEIEPMGLFAPQDDLIYIDPRLKGESYYTTLLHEIGHITMHRNGLAYTRAFNSDIEEIIVETNSIVSYETFLTLLERFRRDGLSISQAIQALRLRE